MSKYVIATDKERIHYKISGEGNVGIIFLHGWLGNSDWWDMQQNYFKQKYTVIQMDLVGHGKSGKKRKVWSANQYALDIKRVVDEIGLEQVILVGHSMSGVYALLTSLISKKIVSVILIDTIKDIEKTLTYSQANEFLFKNYRENFEKAIENILFPLIFSKSSPTWLRDRLKKEFLTYDSELAIKIIEPLYKIDLKKICKSVNVPVVAINSDYTYTNIITNSLYFENYNCINIVGTGHYPMMEEPNVFNQKLDEVLNLVLNL